MTSTDVKADSGAGGSRTGIYLAVLQLLFTLGWTTYVIYLPKLAAHQGMLAVGERGNAVKEQPRRPAPYDDIAMCQPKFLGFVAALQSTEQEDRGDSKRHRHDRRTKILFILVLMQRHPGARFIAVDQASIRRKALEACFCGRLARQFAKH